MKNAVILHGKPTRERYFDPNMPKPHKANWFPWIGAKLLEQGVEVSIPPLPKPYYPVYDDWRAVLEDQAIGSETGLVGHSAGAETIVRWMSANPGIIVKKVVLVAPYRDYVGKYDDFSEYDPDVDLPSRITDGMTIINSLDDDEPIQRRTQELVEIFPAAKLVELDGYGHFRIGHNMKTPEFPELLDEINHRELRSSPDA